MLCRCDTMSFITPATVQSIANSLDITRISDDAAKALAPDVEYRLREVIQEALKCMRHSRRTVLTAHDVAQALRIQNIEVLYTNSPTTPASNHPGAHSRSTASLEQTRCDFAGSLGMLTCTMSPTALLRWTTYCSRACHHHPVTWRSYPIGWRWRARSQRSPQTNPLPYRAAHPPCSTARGHANRPQCCLSALPSPYPQLVCDITP